MKRMISLMLALAICFGMLPAASAQGVAFTDVQADSYYADAVAWAVEEEITIGTSATKFSPNQICTRSQVVTFLWRAAGSPEVEADIIPFVDVAETDYFYQAVVWAIEEGITEGMDETHFDPMGQCTRAQVAVFIWRYMGEQSAQGAQNPFKDVTEGTWFTDAVLWAANNGIAKGMDYTHFAPAESCTRAQVVTFLHRALAEEIPEAEQNGVDKELILEEDETVVENGDMLRASSFSLRSAGAAAANEITDSAATDENATTDTKLRYFPVTLYDYDQSVINAATMAKEAEGETVYQGMYFSGGTPEGETTTEDVTLTSTDGVLTIEDGTYLIYCYDTSYYLKGTTLSGSPWGTTVIDGTTANNLSAAGIWTIKNVTGGYTIQNEDNQYLMITGRNSANLTDSENVVQIIAGGVDNSIKISDDAGGEYTFLNSLGDTHYGRGYFGGWSNGSNFQLKKVTRTSYAQWNSWHKGTHNNTNGQKFYTGLVESSLDANNNIVFKVPDGGIFNSDSTVKDIYPKVQMPFVYEDGYYTFDAAQNGVYFMADGNQGSTDKNAEILRLYFAKDTPQTWAGMYYGDGSKTVWAPFNEGQPAGESSVNYHFGMSATIPFSMTSNGRIKATDSTSDEITFHFSGDDDVWVFIDGQLVVDLGGIHNRLDVDIDFAANTVTYSALNNAGSDSNGDGIISDTERYPTGSYNNPDFMLTQELFGNLINKDRATFAAEGDHTLTVYYLERGMGASNCEIKFNLPMKDSVTVTKIANKSWTTDENHPEGGTISNLTDAMQARVDNVDFGFTLYKSTDGGATFSTVANTNYYQLDAGNQIMKIASTDASGHFTLRNGQSAKFITDFADSGVCYYVVEDDLTDMGFVTPDFNFTGIAANGFDYCEDLSNINTCTEHDPHHVSNAKMIPEQVIDVDAEENKSYEVAVYGSEESGDSLTFVCLNYLNADLPNPAVRPVEDRIVIDYGLPVEIDVLRNDIINTDDPDDYELVSVSGEGMSISFEYENGEITTAPVVDTSSAAGLKYGKVEIADGKLIYTPNKQMTGVEVLEYAVQARAEKTIDVDGVEDEIVVYETNKAKVYIIPATTMYYEENFSDLVTYTGSGWGETEGTADAEYQEHGRVGETDNSPYGSDRAYLKDSGDSNGTSRYATTENSTVMFEYTFTGTGTSFYARTTNNSGYMYVTLEGVDNSESYRQFRDTTYQADGTLYNIPVYTQDELPYGTYKVTCYVYHAFNGNGVQFYGSEFWLDGIRVMQPLDKEDKNAGIALEAYSKDGEANMANVTLRNKLIREMEYTEKRDDEGNIVYVTDDDGNIVYLTDENGEQILDEDGNPIPEPVMVLNWNGGEHFAVFTDTNGDIKTGEEYESIGPKEEVYLKKGQSIKFSLKYWSADSYKIYMGMKAPMGTAEVTVGNTPVTLNNAADCYFDISKYALISEAKEQAMDENGNLLYTDADGKQVYQNAIDDKCYYVDTGTEVVDTVVLTPVEAPYHVATFTFTSDEGIVSLTNIKVTGIYQFTIIEEVNEEGDVEINGGEE